MRRAAGYEISDRVHVAVSADAATVDRLAPHRDWLAEELLAVSLVLAPDAALAAPDGVETASLDGTDVGLSVARA
jgi:hypothetical protein